MFPLSGYDAEIQISFPKNLQFHQSFITRKPISFFSLGKRPDSQTMPVMTSSSVVCFHNVMSVTWGVINFN